MTKLKSLTVTLHGAERPAPYYSIDIQMDGWGFSESVKTDASGAELSRAFRTLARWAESQDEPTPKPLGIGDPVTYAPSFASQLPCDGWTIDRLPTEPTYIITHPGGSAIAVAASEISRPAPNRGTSHE